MIPNLQPLSQRKRRDKTTPLLQVPQQEQSWIKHAERPQPNATNSQNMIAGHLATIVMQSSVIDGTAAELDLVRQEATTATHAATAARAERDAAVRDRSNAASTVASCSSSATHSCCTGGGGGLLANQFQQGSSVVDNGGLHGDGGNKTRDYAGGCSACG